MKRRKALVRLVPAVLCLFGLGGLFAATPIDWEQTRTVAREAEQLSKRFKADFDDELDKSILNGLKFEKRLDKRSDQLRAKLDDVHDRAKSGKGEKLRKQLDRALELAHDINLIMLERRFSQSLEDNWRALRDRLDFLAIEFGLDPLVQETELSRSRFEQVP